MATSEIAQDNSPTPTSKTDVYGILSIVFLFIFSLVGLILGIIGLAKAKKGGYSNTLSVIGVVLNSISVAVFILVIPLLVITTFSGVQVKARDTKRETDVKALASQLEVYYANYGYYPSLAELQNNVWLAQYLPGLTLPDAVLAPNATGTNSITSTPSITTYAYVATPVGCTTTSKNCTGFTLTAVREEAGSTPVVKANLTN